MSEYKFKLLDSEILKEIANIGAGNAVTSLANLINQKVNMTVPEVTMAPFKDLANVLNGPEAIVAGVLVKISGDINGMMMYVMHEESACTLIKLLIHKEKTNISEFDDMDISVLTEIGNILNSSYLTALSKLMNFSIKQSIPYISVDMAGAILSVPAIEFGKVGDTVLLIKSTFNHDEDLNGFFILIPDADQEVTIKY